MALLQSPVRFVLAEDQRQAVVLITAAVGVP
jgi:hypothetical protein